MQVTEVRAVIAIGRSGQFGLRGRLPWEGNRGRVPGFAFKDRDIIEIHASDRPADVLGFPHRHVFIGGGPPVYAANAPFIRHWDNNRLPYDGEADRWFDPAWLVAGGHRV
jgi:dihydromethanopterin reductase